MSAPTPTDLDVGYLRISSDTEGKKLGVGRQQEDITAAAAREGRTISHFYVDNDTGASSKSKKPRPEYQRMLRDAKAGKFKRIWAYTSGRITRRPREHEDLIELSVNSGIKFKFLKSPSFDLNTAHGRQVARILAATDAAESEEISERVSRAARQRAEQGLPHGGRVPFGYRKNSSGGYVLEPTHAAWLREAAQDLLAGKTLYSISTAWHRAGRQTAQGKTWRPASLRSFLVAPAVVGIRTYHDEEFPAQWPAILERETWEKVCVLLEDPSRMLRAFPTGGSARKYPLSGILRCGGVMPDGKPCGRNLVAAPNSGRTPGYICSVNSSGGCGRLRIDMKNLENWIIPKILDLITSPEYHAARLMGDEPDGKDHEIRNELVEDRKQLQELADDYDDRKISKPEYQRRRARLEKRLEENQAHLDSMVAEQARINIPENLMDLWPHLDNTEKRNFLALGVDHIVIKPFPPGMQSTKQRTRGESLESLRQRRKAHTAKILSLRVELHRRA
jgi:site-specific DNA recombinase